MNKQIVSEQEVNQFVDKIVAKKGIEGSINLLKERLVFALSMEGANPYAIDFIDRSIAEVEKRETAGA